MAGYSGTPLDRKLGIKAGFRIVLDGLPAEVEKALARATKDCTSVRSGGVDFALVCCESRAKVKKSFAHWSKRLAPAGMLWIGWPKRSSGIATDVDGNVVREAGLAARLVDVKVCALSEQWSALKFVIRVKDRAKA